MNKPKGLLLSARNLSMMGLLVALSGVLSLFTLYASETFRVLHFVYLPGAIASVLFGPLAAVLVGVASDFVGFIIKPAGLYHPGYMLSAVVQNLLYVMFLYRRPLKLWRITAAQVLVTLIVSLGLNYLWLKPVLGEGTDFFVWGRIASNAAFLPLHTALLFGGCLLARRWEKSYGKAL